MFTEEIEGEVKEYEKVFFFFFQNTYIKIVESIDCEYTFKRKEKKKLFFSFFVQNTLYMIIK